MSLGFGYGYPGSFALINHVAHIMAGRNAIFTGLF